MVGKIMNLDHGRPTKFNILLKMIHFKVADNSIQHFFSTSSLTNQYRYFIVSRISCKTNFEFASKARITNVKSFYQTIFESCFHYLQY